jgi:hypothetical protein
MTAERDRIPRVPRQGKSRWLGATFGDRPVELVAACGSEAAAPTDGSKDPVQFKHRDAGVIDGRDNQVAAAHSNDTPVSCCDTSQSLLAPALSLACGMIRAGAGGPFNS